MLYAYFSMQSEAMDDFKVTFSCVSKLDYINKQTNKNPNHICYPCVK